MISHITLAHRVSTIRGSYARIHSAVFGFSLGGVGSIRLHKLLKSRYCQYEEALRKLGNELAEVQATVEGGNDIDLSTTLQREFNIVLTAYVLALGDAIARLSEVCSHLCKEHRGLGIYDAAQSRADRTAYDEAVQYYQRLGGRLERLFKLL